MKNLFATLLIATTLSLPAQNSLPLKKVIIFKNATAVIVKEGNAAVKNGNVMLPIPEQTLFGTFFIGTAKDNSIKNIIFKNDTVKKKVASNSIWQFLAGNKNKQVSISYTPTQGIDKTVSGKVVEYNSNSGILKFVADADKNIVIPVAKIYQADFKEDPSDFYMADSVKRLMVLNPDKPTDNISLQEIYMTTGINWIPSYYLKLKDDKIARLEMKATLENYAEELKDAETELVVGAPQMSNNGKMDPMTYDYLTVTGNSPVGYAGKSYMQSNAMVARTAEISDNSFFDQNFSTEGEKNGDMYLYKLGKISLPQNSKGVFPIFATDIEYKDKYEGTISDFTNYFNTRFVPQDEKTFDIFHSLEIKNTSTVPLTTASVMVVNKKDQFVAQDEIKYTPVGASSNIRLSKAIDIIMKNSEEENQREDNAKKIGKTTYSKQTLKGTVTIENYQDKEVTISITKSLNGTVTAQSDNAKVTKANSYNYINPASNIKWDVNLKAKEKKTFTYEYEVYFVP